jgi:hypothetical protein
MLFREIIAVYCENHAEQTNKLNWLTEEFWCAGAGGKYSDHRFLKG